MSTVNALSFNTTDYMTKTVFGLKVSTQPVLTEIYPGYQIQYYTVVFPNATFRAAGSTLKNTDFTVKNSNFYGFSVFNATLTTYNVSRQVVDLAQSCDADGFCIQNNVTRTVYDAGVAVNADKQADFSKVSGNTWLLAVNTTAFKSGSFDFTVAGVNIDPEVWSTGNLVAANTVYTLQNNLSLTDYTLKVAQIANWTGTPANGTVAGVQSMYGTQYNVTENSGAAPVLTIGFNFTNVNVNFNQISLFTWYYGSNTHVVNVDLLNNNGTWVTFGRLWNNTVFGWWNYTISDPASYVSNGNVTARLYHSSSGTGTHYISLDYAVLMNNETPARAALNVTAVNVTIDCNGYWINGNATLGSYGVWSNKNNITVKNCNFNGLARSVYFNASYGLFYNNSFLIPANNTASVYYYDGLMLDGGSFSNVSYNNFLENLAGPKNSSTSPYNPASLLLSLSKSNIIAFNTFNTTANDAVPIYLILGSSHNLVYNNSILAKGVGGYGIFVSSSTNNNSIFLNNVTTRGNTAYGVYVYSGSNNNSIYLNNITTTASSSGFGLQAQSSIINLTVYSNVFWTNGSLSHGISLNGASNSTIFSNNVTVASSNTKALLLQNAVNNSFFLNNFTSISVSGASLSQYSTSSANYWSNYFFAATSTSNVIELGQNGAGSTGNNTGTFTNDTFVCQTCNNTMWINQSSSATLTNVTFNRSSSMNVGVDAQFRNTNITFNWPVRLNLTFTGNSSPAVGVWVNATNSNGTLQSNLTDSNGIVLFQVLEFTNKTNSTGTFSLNYTPFQFDVLNYTTNASVTVANYTIVNWLNANLNYDFSNVSIVETQGNLNSTSNFYDTNFTNYDYLARSKTFNKTLTDVNYTQVYSYPNGVLYNSNPATVWYNVNLPARSTVTYRILATPTVITVNETVTTNYTNIIFSFNFTNPDALANQNKLYNYTLPLGLSLNQITSYPNATIYQNGEYYILGFNVTLAPNSSAVITVLTTHITVYTTTSSGELTNATMYFNTNFTNNDPYTTQTIAYNRSLPSGILYDGQILSYPDGTLYQTGGTFIIGYNVTLAPSETKGYQIITEKIYSYQDITNSLNNLIPMEFYTYAASVVLAIIAVALYVTAYYLSNKLLAIISSTLFILNGIFLFQIQAGTTTLIGNGLALITALTGIAILWDTLRN